MNKNNNNVLVVVRGGVVVGVTGDFDGKYAVLDYDNLEHGDDGAVKFISIDKSKYQTTLEGWQDIVCNGMVGRSFEMPNPTDDDCWQYGGFCGIVKGYRKGTGLVSVCDLDDNCFDIEYWRLVNEIIES